MTSPIPVYHIPNMYQGELFEQLVSLGTEVTDPLTGEVTFVPEPTTGKTLRSDVRLDPGSPELIASFSFTVVDEPGGIWKMSMVPTDTRAVIGAALEGNHPNYDVKRFVDADATQVKALWRGEIIATEDHREVTV